MDQRKAALRVIAALCLMVSFAALGSARAAEQKATLATVATGLDNPRGMAFGPGGALYVAEAGRGGPDTGACRTSAEGGEECFGATGAITRVTLPLSPTTGISATQQRVLTGLPSLAAPGGPQAGAGATGPHDVSVLDNGDVYAVIGFGGPPISRTAELEGDSVGFAQLIKVSGNYFLPVSDADLGAYEAASDPDTAGADTNPYSVLALRSWRVAVDAGGNSLLAVLPDGAIVTLATFPTRDVPAPPGLPGGPPAGTPIPMQSVPTSVAIGSDGAYYVGELTGFPFLVGEARVYRVVPGQTPTVYASGFTAIVDLAFDAGGNLYVLELFDQGVGQALAPGGSQAGELLRVAAPSAPGGPAGATTSVIGAGLTAPGGLAISPQSGIYVSNQSISAGAGEVVRVDTCGTSSGCTEPQAAAAPLSALAVGGQVAGDGDPDGLAATLLTLDAAGGQVCLQSLLSGLDAPTQVQLRVGAEGVSGPPVIDFTSLLAAPPSAATISGCVSVSPSIVSAILQDPEAFYLSVANAAYPGGAVRAQLALATSGVSEQVLPVVFK